MAEVTVVASIRSRDGRTHGGYPPTPSKGSITYRRASLGKCGSNANAHMRYHSVLSSGSAALL
jgi:hypothetical protein